jgi:peptide/nickel transport system substrate-binding protein
MRHLRWQALIALLGMILVGSILAGQSRVEEALVSVTQPAAGGLYTEALAGAPQRLNPLLDYANPVDRDIDRLIFSGLTRFDASGKPAPDLAIWIIGEDQQTYTFILKPNLRWHDGQPLTAEDAAFTLRLLQDPAYPGPADVGRLWQSVSVRVVNPQTLVLTLPEPFAPFLDYTAVGLLPAHLLEDVPAAQLAQADFNLNPVGSGPFRFERWLQGEGGEVQGVLLAAAPTASGPSPLLTQVQFNFYPDAAAAWAAYQQGQVLGLGRVDEAQLEAVLQEPELNLYTTLKPEYSLIFLNQRSDELPFFKEKKVRQALLLGLNRAAMVNDLLRGQAVVASSPVLPGSWAYHPDLPVAAYDPGAAASLLDSAGWVFPADAAPGTEAYTRQKEGVPLSFTLTATDDPLHVALARSAQSTWAGLGIKVEVAVVDSTSLRRLVLEPRQFQALLVDFNLAGTPDPDPYPFWHETQAESGQNYGGFADRRTSELLEQARITTDITQRALLYRDFQSRFVDQVPALLLYYPVYNYAVDESVGGVQLGPLTTPSDRFNSLPGWFLRTSTVPVEEPSGSETPAAGVTPTP